MANKHYTGTNTPQIKMSFKKKKQVHTGKS